VQFVFCSLFFTGLLRLLNERTKVRKDESRTEPSAEAPERVHSYFLPFLPFSARKKARARKAGTEHRIISALPLNRAKHKIQKSAF
jgi:hypothetical protein